ncbi:MAG: NAD(P)/FAD-dependent oxidoreductase, partial [Solirubrobacteraceae bacterium]|nr:NAD(P)/FAD-dependent oxidoreductase [Solirubrobacteraceae bacterium]
DSDMHTLGFSFRPWSDPKAIADGPAILQYLKDTAAEYGIDEKIQYGTKVVGASWSTPDAQWTVDVEDTATGEHRQLTCGFLFSCTGYYKYDQGYTPEFAGRDSFKGQIVHPQHWPEDLDYAGKRVVVIGSGATAVTLVPAMAPEAEQVTMLQRTPTYIMTLPGTDPLAKGLSKVLPEKAALPVVRWKNILQQLLFFSFAQRYPKQARGLIRKLTMKQLPKDYPVDTHFNPPYNPWDQRLCAVPDGDLFRALRKGNADIVTDHIERFDETGIQLKSGHHLDADIIITATGLDLLILGGLELKVDGEVVNFADRMAYKGVMLEGVPNYAFTIGYTNSSWTLKADMTSNFVGRLLKHMADKGYKQVVPVGDPTAERRPLLDFGAGYVERVRESLPRQGNEFPWTVKQNYVIDRKMFKRSVDDGVLAFSSPTPVAGTEKAAEPATA